MERVKKPSFYVLLGGLVAGTFDITYACTFWYLKRGVLPTRVLQSVASGLLGDASFTGGRRTALLGLALHYFIATSMAVTYFLFARRWSELWQKPWVFGPLYGVLLYGIMNYIVVPVAPNRPDVAPTTRARRNHTGRGRRRFGRDAAHCRGARRRRTRRR